MKVEIIKQWCNMFGDYRFFVYLDGSVISSKESEKDAKAFVEKNTSKWKEIEAIKAPKLIYSKEL